MSAVAPIAVYGVIVLGVYVSVMIYQNGEVILKAGQQIIDASSRLGRASSDFIKKTQEKIEKANKEKKKKQESDERIREVLRDKEKERETSSCTTIYVGKGGKDAADRDFDKLNDGKTRTYPNGTKVVQLPDGSSINVREKSHDGRITLEIQRGKRTIKIRYK